MSLWSLPWKRLTWKKVWKKTASHHCYWLWLFQSSLDAVWLCVRSEYYLLRFINLQIFSLNYSTCRPQLAIYLCNSVPLLGFLWFTNVQSFSIATLCGYGPLARDFILLLVKPSVPLTYNLSHFYLCCFFSLSLSLSLSLSVSLSLCLSLCLSLSVSLSISFPVSQLSQSQWTA